MDTMLSLYHKEQDGYGQDIEVFATIDALMTWMHGALEDVPTDEAQKVLSDCREHAESGSVWEFNGNHDTEERALEGTHFLLKRCEVRR